MTLTLRTAKLLKKNGYDTSARGDAPPYQVWLQTAARKISSRQTLDRLTGRHKWFRYAPPPPHPLTRSGWGGEGWGYKQKRKRKTLPFSTLTTSLPPNLSLHRKGRCGTTDDFSQPVSSIFLSVLHSPLGLGELQACQTNELSNERWCCLLTHFQPVREFDQQWWTEHATVAPWWRASCRSNSDTYTHLAPRAFETNPLGQEPCTWATEPGQQLLSGLPRSFLGLERLLSQKRPRC